MSDDRRVGVVTRLGCDGCLGDRACWVCLGQGKHTSRIYGLAGPECARCHGTGRCSLCCDLDASSPRESWIRRPPPLMSIAI
jgi:hypothetical protein